MRFICRPAFETAFLVFFFMLYKNLFFDLDDTLWAFSLNARDTYEEMYWKYGYDRYFDSFEHYYLLYQLFKILGRGGENQNHPIDIPVLNQR